MTVTLNQRAYERAKELIEGLYSTSEMHGASTSRPPWRKANTSASTALPNTANGIWELQREAREYQGNYEFPYGDFKDVHRCGVLAAESRAGQYQHYDIENAAAHLME